MIKIKTIITVLLTALVVSFGSAASAQRVNKLIELFENNEPAFGILSFDYSLNNARSLATSGLDFVFIDMEHAPFDEERLREFLLGMTNKRLILEKGSLQPDVVPFVRIPAAGGAEELIAQAKQVLDLGVFGIFFPAIHTREQAELAVRATRYPQYNGVPDYEPAGLRGRNPSNAAWYWGIDDYHAKADVWPLDPQGELLAMMFIESAEGVENIHEIIDVPGLGGIFIGPSDLSTSMGYTSPAAPQVEEAIQLVLQACLDNDVPCAITTGAGSVEQRIEQGFSFVTVGADGGLNSNASAALRLGREAGGRD
ncbi:aldolase/citrate lyase family protein [Gammaproteobacteria bacterium]|jgi:4-hydroxy-2-oxoheptanedioate aldolase|nr:aldolase/citrate lyase family protein [Gammaproteobacteria bacterium]|tara:strand:+ start:1140 stop:2072 length:933 start_codon:yes stop_codon:yes gene_type:complete